MKNQNQTLKSLLEDLEVGKMELDSVQVVLTAASSSSSSLCGSSSSSTCSSCCS